MHERNQKYIMIYFPTRTFFDESRTFFDIQLERFLIWEVEHSLIHLKEINLKTMESLKIKNLYFTGEIIDINGDCGGYNLGFAWISGLLAGGATNDKN